MDYPVLHWTSWGGGLLIALVATIHVFISHFAVGGGLFIAVMETRTQRLGLTSMRDYLRRYANFFLLLTMVVGGLTGVGIWFAVSITAPGAASKLIHAFVLGWATEWTFFLAEIVVLVTYMRSFEGQRSTRRLILAWLYFAFAFGSLVIVQGFISFMLTPGEWVATQRFWDGFFNPTYWPGLALRSGICATLAGTFGLMTAQGVADEGQRKSLSRFCAVWAALPVPLVALAGWWHISVLSPEQQVLARGLSPEVADGMRAFWWAAPAIVAGGALLAGGLSRKPARIVATLTLAASFLFIASFEYMREAARRPYLITGYIYSNGILVSQAAKLNQAGVLASARWSRVKDITPENRLEAGRELFFLECSSCHSQGGPMLDMLPRSAKYSATGMEALLTGLGKIGTYMPPFIGTQAEKKALAAYLTEGLHGAKPAPDVSIAAKDEPVPPFDGGAEYLLTVSADKGVNMLYDATGQWSLNIGAQGLTAQLIKRGPSPELVTKDVTLTYSVEGQAGGSFVAKGRAFRAENIQVSPYRPNGQNGQEGGFAPYPVAVVQASDASGKVLAETKVVLPVSTELGCKNCHGGSWTHGVAGLSDATGRDILKAHDRLSRTGLKGQAPRVDCRSCHDDAASGNGRSLNLSAAVHGLHAVYLAGRGSDACDLCHPTSPKGATRAFRDPHAASGLDCTSCHGPLEDHALSLLTREDAQGVPAAKPLMKLITQRDNAPVARVPWVNEPKCVTCHTNFGPPEGMNAYGKWTEGADDLFIAKRDDMDALTCAACHGTPHSVYPADNPYGKDRDNLQPLQYQGLAKPLGGNKNCKSCHTTDMDMPVHHPGMGVQ
jgi:mono/diheme cytochrome c family protein